MVVWPPRWPPASESEREPRCFYRCQQTFAYVPPPVSWPHSWQKLQHDMDVTWWLMCVTHWFRLESWQTRLVHIVPFAPDTISQRRNPAGVLNWQTCSIRPGFLLMISLLSFPHCRQITYMRVRQRKSLITECDSLHSLYSLFMRLIYLFMSRWIGH